MICYHEICSHRNSFSGICWRTKNNKSLLDRVQDGYLCFVLHKGMFGWGSKHTSSKIKLESLLKKENVVLERKWHTFLMVMGSYLLLLTCNVYLDV